MGALASILYVLDHPKWIADAPDGASPSSQIEEKEILLKSDGHVSAVSSDPDSQGFLGEKVAPFPVPGEIHVNGHKHSPNSKRAASYSDNFSSVVTTYLMHLSFIYFSLYLSLSLLLLISSQCPTGRISFKLYDWNPAEFPRRLRLQVFNRFLLQFSI